MIRNTESACLLALAWLGLGCASPPEAPPSAAVETEAPDPGWQERTSELADAAGRAVTAAGRAAGRAASNVGSGVGTAYRGVRQGFQESGEGADFGLPPADYVTEVKKYFQRVLRFPDDARFEFGTPTRGYMNQGLLRGGEVTWRGYLIDVEVDRVPRLLGPREPRSYLVRMRDGEVIDVHRGSEHSLLHRYLDAPPPDAGRASAR